MNEDEVTISDVDELMDRDPLSLSDADIDAIIAYQRKQRLRRASGEKMVKDTGRKPVDLSAVLGKLLGPKVRSRGDSK